MVDVDAAKCGVQLISVKLYFHLSPCMLVVLIEFNISNQARDWLNDGLWVDWFVIPAIATAGFESRSTLVSRVVDGAFARRRLQTNSLILHYLCYLVKDKLSSTGISFCYSYTYWLD